MGMITWSHRDIPPDRAQMNVFRTKPVEQSVADTDDPLSTGYGRTSPRRTSPYSALV